MPKLDPLQAKVLHRALGGVRGRVLEPLAATLREQMRGFEPHELRELAEEITLVEQQLAQPLETVEVHEVHARLLKTVAITERRALAGEVDVPRQRTAHREAIRYLEKEVRVLDQIMLAPWFSAVTAARLPRLTDYLSVRFAEQGGHVPSLLPRAWDEKFAILEAPRLFIPDLAHYRARCELRDATVCVAFVDIDDFKAFNTEYGEARVDRDLLPALMERLEAHVFARGHAYRFGGDEYVLLLPNTPRDAAVASGQRLQRALADLSLPGIRRVPTVSIGVCHVEPDSFLTDRDAQERAGRAKNHAKEHGKNRIACYDGELFRDEDLRVIGPA